jgi:hypothetical protein
MLLGLTVSTRELHAQEERADWTEAAKLFDEGRRLMMGRGTLDRACDVLKQSYSLRRRGDTLLNLAECHRRQGKTATAWREFDEAIRYAEAAEFNEAVQAAQLYRDQLAKTLSELVVEAPTGTDRPEGLTVTLDGEPLPDQQWGQTLYVDPGTHQVAATAPDHHPFSASALVGPKGDRSVVVLKLLPIPKPPPTEPPPAKPPPPSEMTKPEAPVWAIVVGSVGVAMMGVSAGFLADSISAGDELDDTCGGRRRNHCRPGSPFAETYDREVRGFGLFVGLGAGGLIATGVGVVGLAVGLTAEPSPVAVLPWADPSSVGASVVGRF